MAVYFCVHACFTTAFAVLQAKEKHKKAQFTCRCSEITCDNCPICRGVPLAEDDEVIDMSKTPLQRKAECPCLICQCDCSKVCALQRNSLIRVCVRLFCSTRLERRWRLRSNGRTKSAQSRRKQHPQKKNVRFVMIFTQKLLILSFVCRRAGADRRGVAVGSWGDQRGQRQADCGAKCAQGRAATSRLI